ncbi:hypothetical protein ACG2LH_01510 [Zhouia sp. PK063]|uniref:hypothetical protein n=1 Tax=Zhouia sp. PK063 TaxID=3373602 RepID=UPI0037A2EF00
MRRVLYVQLWVIVMVIPKLGLAQQLIARQGFESSTADSWGISNMSSSSSCDEVVWGIVSSNGDETAHERNLFWGASDLDGASSCDEDSFKTLIFDDIAVSGYTNKSISFWYYSVGFESNDYVKYELVDENNNVTEVELHEGEAYTTSGWEKVEITLPDAMQTLTLKIIVRVNAASEYVGIDDVELRGEATTANSFLEVASNSSAIYNGDTNFYTENNTHLEGVFANEDNVYEYKLTNTGNAILSIANISFSGVDADICSITETFPITLNEGESQEIALKVIPENEGIFEATMIISNDSDEDTFEIPLQIDAVNRCETPALSASSLAITGKSNEAVYGGFASNEFANANMVLISKASSLTSLPQDGETYTDNFAFGAAVVVQSNSNTSFSVSGLEANTTYTIFVIPYTESSCIGGPKYRTASITSKSFTTYDSPCVDEYLAEGEGSTNFTLTGDAYIDTYSSRAHRDPHFIGLKAADEEAKYVYSCTNPETLYFWSMASGVTSNFAVEVSYSSDGTNWTTAKEIVANGANSGDVTATYQQFKVPLYLSGDYYLKWKMTSRSSGSFYLDDIQVYCNNSCSTTTVWNGDSWSNGSPTSNSYAIFEADYNVSGTSEMDACAIKVDDNATVTFSNSSILNVGSELKVLGNLEFSNNASLLTAEGIAISGTVKITRQAATSQKYDYTYWSSPVQNAMISKTFVGWDLSSVYYYNPENFEDDYNLDGTSGHDGYDDDLNDWVYAPGSNTMQSGKGYIVRALADGSFSAVFKGKPNNGEIITSISKISSGASDQFNSNLIGNPYPSAIDADTFIDENSNISGTLYFWTHIEDLSEDNEGPYESNYSPDDYAMYNKTGGTSASASGSSEPIGYIASGQAFMVNAIANGNVVFTNEMRDETYTNSQFFKNSIDKKREAKDRFWVSMFYNNHIKSQQLIGFFSETTPQYDVKYDGKSISGKTLLNFYSLLENNEKLAIQARESFNDSIKINLGYTTQINNYLTIAVNKTEGKLKNATIYLEDHELGITHNLSTSSYRFLATQGTFNNRFTLKFVDHNKVADITNDQIDDHQLKIYKESNQVYIKNTTNTLLKQVILYDLSGRLLAVHNQLQQEDKMPLPKIRAVYLIKIVLANNSEIIKKVIAD